MRTALLVLLISPIPLLADWRGFRGDGRSVSPESKLPETLSDDTLVWKAKLPGLGASSPVVVKDRVFVTCYSGFGTKLTGGGLAAFLPGGDKKANQDGLRLWVVGIDRVKGDILWKNEIPPKLPETPFASFVREHGYASSTPVSDGRSLFVFFGKTGVIAFDLDGKELWRASVGDNVHQWGSAASLALSDKTVVVNATLESGAIVGLDKATGKEVWRSKKIDPCWTSPVVVRVNGVEEAVINSPGKVLAFDAATGEELWSCQGLGGGGPAGATCSTPASIGDVLFMMSASPSTPPAMLAVKAGGRGDVTKTHILWKQKVGAGICSPVAHEGRVYINDGVLSTLNADTGKILSRQRLYDVMGEYTSPALGDGRLYIGSRSDGLFVLSVGDTPKSLSQTPLKDDRRTVNASPAISQGSVFIRSNEHLYRFGK